MRIPYCIIKNELAIQTRHAALGLNAGETVLLEVMSPGLLKMTTQDPDASSPQQHAPSVVGASAAEVCMGKPSEAAGDKRKRMPSATAATPAPAPSPAGQNNRAGKKRTAAASATASTPGTRAKKDADDVAAAAPEASSDSPAPKRARGSSASAAAEAKAATAAAQARDLIKRRVVKLFEGQPFKGAVIGYDPEEGYYKVRYEDGDEEELDAEELADILVDESQTQKKKKKNSPAKRTRDKRFSEPAPGAAGAGDVGEALVSRKVVKSFDGVPFDGEVRHFDAALGFYTVVYSDGDREELEAWELEEVIVGGMAKTSGGGGGGGGGRGGGKAAAKSRSRLSGGGGGGGSRSSRVASPSAKKSLTAAKKQMPKPMSLPGCGGGHARNACAVYHHGE